jgi:hypothetical protein
MYRRLFFLLFSTGLSFNSFCQDTAEAAIKQLLERESTTWRAGDAKAHADCWHIQPYSRILVSTGDSTVMDVPPAVMLNPPAAIFGKGGSFVNSNYKMNIAGNYAWVSHDEESTSAEGVKQFSSEFRMLEKINGQWKLVGQSIHINKARR